MFKVPQFILSKNKMPMSRDLTVINAFDSRHWMDYPTAKTLADLHGPEIRPAFVLTEDCGYFCLDIDNALAASGADWNEQAKKLCRRLSGAYVEVSQSGTALHIWGRCTFWPKRSIRNTKKSLELYSEKRFIVLGDHGQGDPDMDCTGLMSSICAEFFPAKSGDTDEEGMEWTIAPCEGWSGPDDDDELIALALERRSWSALFGGNVYFSDLWDGNAEALAQQWPREGGGYDASSADASLAARLAFFTGKNCQRISELMQRSALKRPKWDREDYLPRTILNACRMQERVLNDLRYRKNPAVTRNFTGGFVPSSDIPEVFQGCTYVLEDNQIFTPQGYMVNKDRFNVLYGGYIFSLDDHKTSRKAWDAFTECPSWRPPTAERKAFRPELPPGQIFDTEGMCCINTYVPVQVDRAEGSVSRFEKWIKAIYPDDRDRGILLSYMAACVQNPGRKFQWAPLLQGPEGTGKGFLTQCMVAAIGKRYVHTVNSSDLDGNGAKFNAWLFGRLFIVIEEIKVGNKREIMELLKPMITNELIEIQAKGQSQVTLDNRANFILTSNYIDALAIDENSRRYAPLASGPQTAEELLAAGMSEDFFADLWDWARARGKYEGKTPGFNHIAEFLHSFKPLDAFNPAGGCVRAPDTSRKSEFIRASVNSVDYEIKEAIAQELPGFAGGWVSSRALEDLLKKARLSRYCSPHKRVQILEGLGYRLHPALPEGRTTRRVHPDGGRPRLYSKAGHPIESIKCPKQASDRYERDQGIASQLFGHGSAAAPPVGPSPG